MVLKVSNKVIAIVLLFYISCQSLFLQQKIDVEEFLATDKESRTIKKRKAQEI